MTKTGVEVRPVGPGNSERLGRSAAALDSGGRAILTLDLTELDPALFGAAPGDTNPIPVAPAHACRGSP
ncbi:hypothetical protein JCM30394_32140 [Deferrisoma palaeochoriense]